MRATRPQASVVVLLLLLAGTARAGWVRSPAAGQLSPNLPLIGVAMVSPSEVWAVGGNGTAAFIVRSSSQFMLAADTAVFTGHSLTRALNGICVPPGTTDLHALGDSDARASRVGGTWTFTNPHPSASTSIKVMQCLDDGSIIAGGQNFAGVPYLERWSPPATASPLTPVYGSALAVSALGFFSGTDGFYAHTNDLVRYPDSSPFAPIATPTAIRSMSVRGTKVLALASATLVDVTGTGATVVPNSGFSNMRAIYLAPAGFAVAVGALGEIAESYDEGATWRRVREPVTGQQTLNAVHCHDENTCVAVGAAAELLYYVNAPPSATITTDQASLTLGEGTSFCFSAQDEADPEGDAIALRSWSFDGGAASPTAPCLTTSTALCADTVYPVTLELGDGRARQTLSEVLTVVDSHKEPPSAPATSPSGPQTWRVGQAYSVTASGSTVECGRTISGYEYTTTGDVPAPVASGTQGESALFDLTNGPCVAGPASVEVRARDSAGNLSAPTTIPVTVQVDPMEPVLSVSPAVANTVTGTDSLTVSIGATHPCTTAYSYAWSCSASPDVAVPLPPANAGSSYTFTNPGTLCSDTTISCSVTVTPQFTGQLPKTTTFTVTLAATPYAPTFEPAVITPSAAVPAGGSAQVLVRPRHACTTFDYAWSCSAPAPIAAPQPPPGSDGFTFENPGTGLCTDDSVIHCVVRVTPAGHPPADYSFDLTYGAARVAPTFNPIASPGAIAPGQTATVSASAAHPCALSYAWSCPALQTVGQSASWSGASASFAHPRDLCDPVPVQCTVTATPSGSVQHPSASATVDFSYDAPKAAPVFGPMPTPGSLPPGAATTVTVAATHACPVAYAWSCDTLAQVEPLHPLAPGPSQTFSNPGQLCSDVPVACTVTATPGHGHPSATGTLGYTYAASLFPPTWTLQYSSGEAIAEGGATTATVVPQHCSGATFNYRWSNCSPGVTAPADGTPSITFQHPGRDPFFCSPKTASCQVVVSTSVGAQAHPDTSGITVPVELAPAFAPATQLTLQVSGGSRPGDTITVQATSDAQCGEVADGYRWSAAMLSQPETPIGAGEGSPSFAFALPEGCGKDAALVTLTDLRSGLQTTTEVPFDSGAALPTIAEPSPADYLPSAEPQLECEAPEPLVIRPQVQPACPGSVRYAWTQTSGPALAFTTRASGELEAPIEVADLAGLAGQTVQYRLEVTDAAGTSLPRDYTVRFLPRPYLDLGHVADRAVAAPGERVAFAVKLRNSCRAAVGPVDLHLRLSGLEYLPGTARLDGQSLGEPTLEDRTLIFRGVPVRPAGEAAPVLSYAARRSALAGDRASAEASAWLTAAPKQQVSRTVRAEEGGWDDGLGAVACGCGSAGSPALGALAALFGLLWRRRR